MMQDKAFGSLSGSLLARKGGAKPAMRPQAFRFDEGDETAADDDCGWNDMGDALGSDMLTPEQRDSLLPAEGAQAPNVATAPVREADEFDMASGDSPALEQQRALEGSLVPETFEAEYEPVPETEEQGAAQAEFLARLERESSGSGNYAQEEAAEQDPLAVPQPRRAGPPRKRTAPGTKSKSAFTLRFDRALHLKLRLACALAHSSAQKLVVEAVEEYLDRHHPDLPA